MIVHNRGGLGVMINAGLVLTSTRILSFDGSVIALWLTGKYWSAVKRELMIHTRRPSVSLVSETGMFL